MEGTSCLTFTNIYCPLGIAFPSFLCSPTCGKVFIHLPAIHLIVSFLLALHFFYDSTSSNGHEKRQTISSNLVALPPCHTPAIEIITHFSL